MIVAMFSRRTQWKLDPNRFTLAHQAALRQGKELIDLALSNPTRAGIEYDQEAILAALHDPKALTYDPHPKGLRSAREAVAEYYSGRRLEASHRASVLAEDRPFDFFGAENNPRERHAMRFSKGAAIDPESMILTTSTSEGYSFIFKLLCSPGDEILVPKPSYPLFDFLADLNDVKLTGYPLIYDNGWQIDFPALDRTLTQKTRAIVVVHPNNPTGSYVSAAELKHLNQLCSRHSLALIADEVFLDYRLPDFSEHSQATGMPHPSHSGEGREVDLPRVAHKASELRSFVFNHDVLTFTLSGLSKISALPQMKLAWIIVNGPEPQKEAALERLELIADTYLSLNAPVQLAAKTLLDQRHTIQPQLMSHICENLKELDRQLGAQKPCTRLALEGGWYAVLRVPATQSDEDLAIALLEKCSVLVHPGHFYDIPRDGYLVLSLITPPVEFRTGLSRLLDFIDSNAP